MLALDEAPHPLATFELNYFEKEVNYLSLFKNIKLIARELFCSEFEVLRAIYKLKIQLSKANST